MNTAEHNIPIIFEDSALLVIDKPTGLLSIPDGYDAAKPHLRGVLEPQYGRLWIVHRLDKDTSGVLVLARNAAAHRELNLQFFNHQIQKTYHALVIGIPEWDEKIVNAPLRANIGRRKRTVVDPKRGKTALTEIRVLERFRDHSFVEIHPKTGRTHQIRAHLYYLGYPILSDPLYGDGTQTALIHRLALHARSLTFQHPLTREPKTFPVPYPDDFATALQKLNSPPSH